MVTWSKILAWHGTVLQECTNSHISWLPRKDSFPPCHSLMRASGLQVATQGSGWSVWCTESGAWTCLRSLLLPAICQNLVTWSLEALPGKGVSVVSAPMVSAVLGTRAGNCCTGFWTQVLCVPSPCSWSSYHTLFLYVQPHCELRIFLVQTCDSRPRHAFSFLLSNRTLLKSRNIRPFCPQRGDWMLEMSILSWTLILMCKAKLNYSAFYLFVYKIRMYYTIKNVSLFTRINH